MVRDVMIELLYRFAGYSADACCMAVKGITRKCNGNFEVVCKSVGAKEANVSWLCTQLGISLNDFQFEIEGCSKEGSLWTFEIKVVEYPEGYKDVFNETKE